MCLDRLGLVVETVETSGINYAPQLGVAFATSFYPGAFLAPSVLVKRMR